MPNRSHGQGFPETSGYNVELADATHSKPCIAQVGKDKHLNASSQQSLGELGRIVQGSAGVLSAMQQQHWRHEVGILRSMHHVGGRQRLQLSLALEAHDAVKQGVVQTPLVEVLPQVCAVVNARDAHQALDLGGVPLGGAPKHMLPPSGDFSLYGDGQCKHTCITCSSSPSQQMMPRWQ